jgi:hypothetical protein
MLSPGEIAQIKAEIERLEKLRKECTDSGIRERIVAWIGTSRSTMVSQPLASLRIMARLSHEVALVREHKLPGACF